MLVGFPVQVRPDVGYFRNMKRYYKIDRIEYDKDTKNNEWLSNDKESNFIINDIMIYK